MPEEGRHDAAARARPVHRGGRGGDGELHHKAAAIPGGGTSAERHGERRVVARTMMTADTFTWTRYDTLLRLDFVSFAQRCFCELSPRAVFLMNWRIEIIAAKLAALRHGRIRRLIINQPIDPLPPLARLIGLSVSHCEP